MTASGNQDEDGETEHAAGNFARVLFGNLFGAVFDATRHAFDRILKPSERGIVHLFESRLVRRAQRAILELGFNFFALRSGFF